MPAVEASTWAMNQAGGLAVIPLRLTTAKANGTSTSAAPVRPAT